MIITNEYQTPITDELLESLHPEVRDQLLELVNNVDFIRNLISPTRQRAIDRPRDEYGKIIVDVCNPHILEDMDYFRESALHFLKYGVYTHLKPNANPNSEFGKWLKTEIDRIWYGMVRPTDGEWVTGEMYFYLNYMPMELVETYEHKGKKITNRKTSFPRIWESVYLWFHYLNQGRYGGLYDPQGGKYGVQIASRGQSKSFTCASMLSRLFVCGDNEEARSHINAVIMAALKDTLTKQGTLNKFEACIDHMALHTQFPRRRLTSTIDKMIWDMGYLDSETNIKKGTRNTVNGVSIADNPDKGRGQRCTLMVFEEIGAFPKFLDVWSTNEPSVSMGDTTWGQLVAIGTGGSEGSSFEGIKEMLYNPKGYNIYSLPNVFDKNSQGKSSSVMFLGAYLNREGFYNENGVSNVIGAILMHLNNRLNVKYNSTDPNRLTRIIAENPLTIQEAIMAKEGSLFPTAALTDRVAELDINPREFDDVYVGKLKMAKSGKVEFVPTSDKSIREFPHKDNKLEGAIEIFKMPERDSSGNIPHNRYIAGADVYDNDQADSVSLGSIIVMDLWTDNIVAEYTGRPQYADEFYDICRLLTIYYNGRLNYENNKKGLYGYFSRMNCSYLLSDTLQFLKDKDLFKGQTFGNSSKGTVATVGVNNYARKLIRDYLLKPETTVEVIDNEEVEVTKYKLNSIRNRALLRELILWNKDGNYDRVSALGMLMLIREDKIILYSGDMNNAKESNYDAGYLGNDKFFTTNYDEKKELEKMLNRFSR